MISKGKRKFLVDHIAAKVFRDKFIRNGKIDLFALAAKAQSLSTTLYTNSRNVEIKPFVKPSAATEAILQKIRNEILKEHQSNGQSIQR